MYQILSILMSVINLYSMIIFVWVILSWFQTANKTIAEIYSILGKVVEPYVNIFRKFIPPMGGLDLSPLIALIVLQLLTRLIFGFFY